MLRRAFAAVALSYGGCLIAASFTSALPALQLVKDERSKGILFFLTVSCFFPFVVAFTRFGLNAGEGQRPSPKTTSRLKELYKTCPMWRIAWFGFLSFEISSWAAFAVCGDIVDPYLAFLGGIAALSGFWFAFVHPTAKKLFL